MDDANLKEVKLGEPDVQRWNFATKYCVAFAAAAVAETGKLPFKI